MLGFKNILASQSSTELLKCLILSTHMFARLVFLPCLSPLHAMHGIWWNILILVKPWSSGSLHLNLHSVNCSSENSFKVLLLWYQTPSVAQLFICYLRSWDFYCAPGTNHVKILATQEKHIIVIHLQRYEHSLKSLGI